MPPRDTTAEAQTIQTEIHRRLGPAERLRQAMEMSDALRRFAMAGIRLRHPEYSESEIAQALIKQLYPTFKP